MQKPNGLVCKASPDQPVLQEQENPEFSALYPPLNFYCHVNGGTGVHLLQQKIFMGGLWFPGAFLIAGNSYHLKSCGH